MHRIVCLNLKLPYLLLDTLVFNLKETCLTHLSEGLDPLKMLSLEARFCQVQAQLLFDSYRQRDDVLKIITSY